MFATYFEALIHCSLVADVMAAQAKPDALFDVRTHVMHGVSSVAVVWFWIGGHVAS